MQPPSVSITQQYRFPVVILAVLVALLMTGRVEAARQRDPAGSAVSVSGRILSARTYQAAEPCVAAVACARGSSPARPAGDRAAQLLGAEHARIIARLQQMSPAEAWLLEIDVPASIAKHERTLLELRGVPPRGTRAASLLTAEHARIIARLQQMSPAEAWLLEIDVPASIAKHERTLLELRGVWRP